MISKLQARKERQEAAGGGGPELPDREGRFGGWDVNCKTLAIEDKQKMSLS